MNKILFICDHYIYLYCSKQCAYLSLMRMSGHNYPQCGTDERISTYVNKYFQKKKLQ